MTLLMQTVKPALSRQSTFIPVDFVQQIIPSTFEYALFNYLR
jgi:hypothetical protein